MSGQNPVLKKFRTGDRNYVRAQRAWLIIVSHVMMRPEGREHTTYGELAEHINYSRKAGITLGPVLGIVGKLCIHNNFPPLNIVVVSQETDMPGPEAVLREGRSVEDEMEAVSDFDWFAVRVPTTGAFRRTAENLGLG